MTINSVELTPEEMQEAVELYLRSRGLDVTVKEVASKGYPIRSWEIDCAPVAFLQGKVQGLPETTQTVSDAKEPLV